MRSRIALVCTVWGADFTDFFCRYSLATLLSPNGLARAAVSYDFTLLLYTSKEDLHRMWEHQNFRQLSSFVEVKAVLLETLPPAARRGHWIQWHHALLNADQFSSYILLIPDCLYASDAIERIAHALTTSDIVYYCIPQVSIEPLKTYLDRSLAARGEEPFSYLDFSTLDIASLLVKFINPRYAVALDKPDYFVTHPEYLLHPADGRIELQELSCHALAVSSRTTSVSYTLNPPREGAKTAFLDLLAVGVEYTFKYFEQYFRWPSAGMELSRFPTLASWSHHFFEPGALEYTKTYTEILVSGLSAVAQQRSLLHRARSKYARATMQYYAALYAVYEGPARACRRQIRVAIALAMSLPGFRKAIMSDPGPVTVFLPLSKRASQILDLLYDHGDPQLLLRFLLMHVIPGRLTMKIEQTFLFEEATGRPRSRPRLRVIDSALASTVPEAVVGRVVSLPTYVSDDVVTYAATIEYPPAARFVQSLIQHSSSHIAT